jgi:hypothetical protein
MWTPYPLVPVVAIPSTSCFCPIKEQDDDRECGDHTGCHDDFPVPFATEPEPVEEGFEPPRHRECGGVTQLDQWS